MCDSPKVLALDKSSKADGCDVMRLRTKRGRVKSVGCWRAEKVLEARNREP